ncbi:MAG: hypothetical protein UU18_C0009G0027 [Parcubacteria group bacterium GW2011_GWB2_40_8]|nr:MAG: hypothetical protein UT71_C0005G0041 [Parcubacteria group bacterium GW2011_GWF2_40_10]KKR47377.1 MAG: hypothetical protein UT83_C0010G0007 [Parcubacteria group bacterium GW2011_GWA2_40_143]KKR59765.1 MAG: hypothetical protein UT97_C0011G0009 [Parcubacteria group bacterium GW2011_GWC2_40_31]KKR75286.1 MAG: hypothetical protein UU18_C0009G0027 [Parcubacteria group bacterium GW2011_GWB2_40_8]KKR77359.1 MAG: hypothetical protein UU20_C0009G0012 [Parcubacteria group bacterium GW2011_GWE2_40_
MNQKGFANIILVVVIVILVGAVGYFVFIRKSVLVVQQLTPTPTQATNTPKSNPTPQPSNQLNLSAHTNYKKMVSESFDYGNSEQQFGIIRIAGGAGPSSFTTDNRNYLYITDTQNNRVKILNSEGKQTSIINTVPLADIAVDNNGDIYGYVFGSGSPGVHLYKYDGSGSLLGKIENPSAFSEISSSNNVYGKLYIYGNKLYITDNQQNSYLVSSTSGNLESKSEKVNGVIGNSGKRYYVAVNFISPEGTVIPVESRKGLVEIINQSGNKEKIITIEIDGLQTIAFLGEDQSGNIHIQTETRDKTGLKLQVHKYDSTGNLLTTLDIRNGDYTTIGMVKLLHIDQTGDIWQVAPGKSNLLVNRWSTTY